MQKAQRLVRLQAPVAHQTHISTPAVVRIKADFNQAAWHMGTGEQHKCSKSIHRCLTTYTVIMLAVLNMPMNMLR